MKKAIGGLIILLCIIMSLGCKTEVKAASENTPQVSDDIMEQYLLLVLEALSNNDITVIEHLFDDGMTAYVERSRYDETLFYVWDDRNWIDYQKVHQVDEPAQGIFPSSVRYYYEVETDKDTIVLFFSITSEDTMDTVGLLPDKIGYISTWYEYELIHWIFLAIRLSVLGFTLYVSYLCAKKKPRLWGFLIFLILFVNIGIKINVLGEGYFDFSYFIHPIRSTRIITYQGVIGEIQFTFPVVAILYFIKHRFRIKSIKLEINDAE